MTPERAATLVQGCWRRWLGKQKAIRVCAQQLQRVLDPNSGKHYFYNVKVSESAAGNVEAVPKRNNDAQCICS